MSTAPAAGAAAACSALDTREVGRGRQEEGSTARRQREEGGADGSATATATRVTAIASGKVG